MVRGVDKLVVEVVEVVKDYCDQTERLGPYNKRTQGIT